MICPEKTMKIAQYLSVNRISFTSKIIFIMLKTKKSKPNKSKPKPTNSTWGFTLVFPD